MTQNEGDAQLIPPLADPLVVTTQPTDNSPTNTPLSEGATSLEKLSFTRDLSFSNDPSAVDELTVAPRTFWNERPSSEIGNQNCDEEKPDSVLQTPLSPMVPTSPDWAINFGLDKSFQVVLDPGQSHTVSLGTRVSPTTKTRSPAVHQQHPIDDALTSDDPPFQESSSQQMETLGYTQTITDNHKVVEGMQLDEPRPDNRDPLLSFPAMEEISGWELEIEDFTDVQVTTTGNIEAFLQILQRMERDPSVATLGPLAIPPPLLYSWVQLYFEHFHPIFPLIHTASFNQLDTHWLLVSTVAAIGAQFSEMANAMDCSRSMHELVRRKSSYLVSNQDIPQFEAHSPALHVRSD